MAICGPNQQLTKDQVAQLMRNAGFPESVIPVGIAIATAESGLASGNCNLSDPYGGSFGLWQINGAHFNSGATTQACAFDPQCATNFAYQLWSNSNGWTAWGAYTNGSYQQYLGGNVTPSPSNTPLTSGGCNCPPGYHVVFTGAGYECADNQGHIATCQGQVLQPGQDPIATVANFFQSISNLTPWLNNPVRIIKLVTGIVLIGAAIFLIASPEGQVAQAISKGAKKVGI